MNIKLNLNNIEKDCYGIAISENIKPLDIKNEVLFTAVFKEAHNADFLYNFLEFKRIRIHIEENEKIFIVIPDLKEDIEFKFYENENIDNYKDLIKHSLNFAFTVGVIIDSIKAPKIITDFIKVDKVLFNAPKIE